MTQSQNSGTEYRPVKPPNSSFANITKNESFPTKEHCIIFPYIEGSTVKEYVYKLAEVIPSSKIRYCSRISRNRVSFYLDSKSTVDLFLDKHVGFEVNKQYVKGRRLINQDKRIIISNAPPHIPHTEISETIKSFNVEMSSQITFLKFGIPDEGLAHLQSFRRQVYVTNETAEKLPTTAVIRYQNDDYRIFFNDSQVRCFICKEMGHISAACPTNIDEKNVVEESEYFSDATENGNQSNNTSTNSSQKFENHADIEEMQVEPSCLKRPLSTTDSFISETISDSTPDEQRQAKPLKETTSSKTTMKKKLKTNEENLDSNSQPENAPISINTLLNPIEDNFNKHKDEYPISFTNFRVLMDLAKGHKNPIPEISHITQDYNGVDLILKQNYPYLKHRSMKIRFTKLRKKISDFISNKSGGSDDDASWTDVSSEQE